MKKHKEKTHERKKKEKEKKRKEKKNFTTTYSNKYNISIQ